MKYTTFISALTLLYISTTSAEPPEHVAKDILARVHDAKNKVIVAVTESGDIAADTAWLLSAQIKQDSSYMPLFLVLKPEEHDRVLKTLKLSNGSLPALIYYDRHGLEISRVIGAQPSLRLKQVRIRSAIEVN